ncbi:MAG TPA: response regulator transcription factor [Dehalococcoidia bacterium]|jgi:RNA polymerase sigma factor (sigma-70 family)|nr:response regulator transcription factor [Dehalococcoidia bacterium]
MPTTVTNNRDSEAGRPVRVLLADSRAIVRAGARAILSDPAIDIVGEAGSGRDAVSMSQELSPDVVLMDADMPDVDGLQAAAAIKAASPAVSVIIVTDDDAPQDVRRAIEAGVAGYLMKGASPEVLIQAVKLARSGGALIDGKLLASLGENGHAGESRDGIGRLLEALSPREMEVLRYLTAGRTNKEIAREMNYSVGTVKNVVQRIIEKLHVSDRTQAAVYAARAGLDVG